VTLRIETPFARCRLVMAPARIAAGPTPAPAYMRDTHLVSQIDRYRIADRGKSVTVFSILSDAKRSDDLAFASFQTIGGGADRDKKTE
jgi:hypothetical protein